MSNEQVAFAALISRVRDGSQEAAWDLIAQYGDLVLRVVRRQLPSDMRKVFDSEDFVQAAWGTIFHHRSRLSRFGEPTEFIAFLATVAANKVRMEIRRRLRKKDMVSRERPLDQKARDMASGAATPSQVAIARERWFRLMQDQPTHYREVVRLKYLGYQSREIAARLNLDEGTVRRILRKVLRDAWQ
jgi:RNA polymerase sigma factor (sigma-70 family)